MTGSRSVGFAGLHRFAERDAPRHLERHVVRIHIVIRTVVEHHAEVHHGKSGQISARRRVLDSLFDGRNIVLRNRAAENVVHKLKLPAARQRLHLDLAIAVLPVAAGLLLVPPLHIGLAANRLPVRHLRRFQNHFRVIALLQLRHHDFNVLLSGARNQKLLRLRIAEEAQHGIFFHELVQSRPQLVFIGARLFGSIAKVIAGSGSFTRGY